MKTNKGAIFICQLSESHLKVVKCLCRNNYKREFVGLEIEAVPSGADDKQLTEKITQVFKKLNYNNNPLIISLPRNEVTCRYIKIPSQLPREIENIVSLQAPRYLPYPAEELITGYQVVSTDKEGYSEVNLVIAHRGAIERYLGIFKELRPYKRAIVLSSYGLSSFYGYVKPRQAQTVMLIDIDQLHLELAIVSGELLLFSRSFKFSKAQPNWESLLIDELNKTRDVYLKEVSKEIPAKFILTGAGKACQEFAPALEQQTGIPTEVLVYDRINFAGDIAGKILNSEHSFVSLIGLGLKDVEESLNLLPQTLKEEAKRYIRQKEWVRTISLICGIILVLASGLAQNLKNKALYLEKLKIELNKIAKDAKVLEEIEDRLKFMDTRLKKKPTSLEVVYELHRVIPAAVSLVNFSYEEANQVILRGQTQELNSVFTFVDQLEKSAVFKNFRIKVRFATKKRTQTGEVIDFEIVCLKGT